LLRSTWLVCNLLLATAEVATREATAKMMASVFMEVSFVNDVRLFVVTYTK
jgi:hypothetical protein